MFVACSRWKKLAEKMFRVLRSLHLPPRRFRLNDDREEEERKWKVQRDFNQALGAKGLWRYYWRCYRLYLWGSERGRQKVRMAQNVDKLFNKTIRRRNK